MTGGKDLYQRLGGRKAIDAVVDDFYDRVLADERINHYFDDADVEDLRDHQKAFIEFVAGGPTDYDGRGMAAAHERLGITEEDFELVADHLATTLVENGVDEADRKELMSEVASLESAIVTA